MRSCLRRADKYLPIRRQLERILALPDPDHQIHLRALSAKQRQAMSKPSSEA
jgi:hypothetical protein